MIELMKKYRIIILACLLIITNFLYLWYREDKEISEAIVLNNMATYNEEITEEEWKQEIVSEDSQEIVNNQTIDADIKVPVYLCGAVKEVGVYFVDEEAIVQEVIDIGGGMSVDADINAINLARKVVSNEKIYIPKLGEEIDKMLNSYDNGSNQILKEEKININQATKEQLEQLPGIGEVKANQIIHYRNQEGLFASCEELKNVSGIGDKTYSMLEQLITIE